MGEKFGEYLRRLREDRKLSLRDVEESAKISNAYLSQVERGERGIPNFKVLKRLAEAYGVPIAKLMEAVEQEEGGRNVKEKVEGANAEFISRGYEKLSEDKKKTLKEFLQYLVNEEKKKK